MYENGDRLRGCGAGPSIGALRWCRQCSQVSCSRMMSRARRVLSVVSGARPGHSRSRSMRRGVVGGIGHGSRLTARGRGSSGGWGVLLLGGCTLVCDVSCGAPVPRTRVSVWPWHRRASGGRQGRGRDVRRDRVADRRTRARDRERAERSQETQSHAGGRKRSGAAVYYYYFVPACFPSSPSRLSPREPRPS